MWQEPNPGNPRNCKGGGGLQSLRPTHPAKETPTQTPPPPASQSLYRQPALTQGFLYTAEAPDGITESGGVWTRTRALMKAPHPHTQVVIPGYHLVGGTSELPNRPGP